MRVNNNSAKNRGVLKPIGFATSVSLAYIIVFIALSLVMDHGITRDAVALPAIAIFFVLSLIEYGFSKKDTPVPQLCVIMGFVLAFIIAFVMAFVVV
ncbi:hypothetical protein [Psychrobacter aestuarii]|uniref:DUF3953 domain-containing protein n=1 Tax=Psychrobacter aestuarii TaxID=556327 RepID=A0ABN0VR17_9GAMM|nr:hypothetical protein [Psychrobacter aestuarii]